MLAPKDCTKLGTAQSPFMPPKRKKDKELEVLKRRREKAQDKGDLAEEAKLCNTIGEAYVQRGDFQRALRYHQSELSLSEAVGDKLGAGIAHRRVGECLCELGSYEPALQHQMKHLQFSRELGNLVEEQRALATLGRTYFVQSQSEDVGEEETRELLLHAGNAYLRSLDVCDKLGGVVPDRELLEMRSRLYLNLGLVYQTNEDLQSARKFMEKALSIVKELGDLATVLQCHFDLGSLYLQERRPALALRCFREALGVATEQLLWQQKVEVLREMAQAQLLLSNFQGAKSCLKKAICLFQEHSQQRETELEQRKLDKVRKVIHYSVEMEGLGVERVQEKMRLCEKLGDLCCSDSLKAFPAAVKFYGQQLSLAEAHGLEPKDLSRIYVSLARTHVDYGQYSQALLYYDKELDLWKGNATEECDTWTSIAEVRRSAGQEGVTVMGAYREAFKFAGESGNPKQKANVCKALVKFCKSTSEFGREVAKWEKELSSVIEAHPEAALESGEESDSERLEHDSEFETPVSLSEMESDEEEEDEEVEEEEGNTAVNQSRSARGMAVRKKSKIHKRNEKGETLLHIAAIEGNLAAARQLIKEGADVNTRDNCGWLPLHEACNHGHIDIVSLLLDGGAHINDPGGIHCGGVSPLIDAATNGFKDIVQLLVERGANLHHRDAKGQTAADVLDNLLSSATKSSHHYELEDAHHDIRDYLRNEMRKRGWRETEGGKAESQVKSRGVLGGRKTWSHSERATQSRLIDRTGRGVLHSSDEEESPTTQERVGPQREPHSKKKESNNPFQSFTVGKSASKPLDKAPSRSHLNPRLQETVFRSSSSTSNSSRHVKGFYNPLGQVEMPALIPEGEEEEGDMETTCPVIDDWLVDDVGQPPSKKMRKVARDPFATSSSSSERDRVRAKVRPKFVGSRKERMGVTRLQGGSSLASKHSHLEAAGWRKDTVILSDSDPEADAEDMDFWSEACRDTTAESHYEFGADSHTVSHSRPHSSQSHLTPSQSKSSQAPILHQPPTHTSLSTPSTSSLMPLRIRVKIEDKSYMIPCPRELSDGSRTTINWLATQAAERYYTQQGVRPRLSLTTVDGAILCAGDVVSHVLQSGEEVKGVVEHWHLPPLHERYQTASTSAGLACHKKAQKIFQSNTNTSVLDLSHLSLGPPHTPALFQSLQAQSILTSLSLRGNRLKDDAMTLLANALAYHSSLHVLDLSCTAITARGLENLSHPHCPSTFHPTAGTTPWSGLRTLHLGYNPLGLASGPALASLLFLTPGLLELGLQSCGLEGSILERHTGLGQALRALSNLTDISISLNPLQSSGVAMFLQALPTNHLSHLELANTCPQQPLVEALLQPRVVEFFEQAGSALELVDMSHCPLGKEGVGTLSKVLQNCQHLQELRLAGIGLTADTMEPLSRYIARLSGLRVLDMSGNGGLGNLGCLKLLQVCDSEADIKLNLAACGMRSPLPNDLITTLSRKLTKGRVEIAGNSIDQTHHTSVLQ